MFLDTSGLFCVLHQAEAFHEQARAMYKAATSRITHSGILAEFVALAQARRVERTEVLSFLVDLIDNPDIRFVWVYESLYREGLALLSARLDKTYSLCDAVSFILMRHHRLTEALTTDRHFAQEGFRRLLVPA
ncbi:MAG: PIN domain-containing protein [Gemmataceae bacterium]|nr:PIN domain-containing protein [Gemmataceae bacterium]